MSEKNLMENNNNEDGTNNQNEYTVAYTYEDIVNNIDFSSPHINVKLLDKLSVDAEIVVDVPQELGIYEYARKPNYEDENAMDELVAELVDAYYGEDVSVTHKESMEKNIIASVVCSSRTISFSTNYKELGGMYNFCEVYHPQLEGDYDKELVDKAVRSFVEQFQKIIPDEMSMNYRCMFLRDGWWKDIAKKYSVNQTEMDKVEYEYYMVRMYPEMENGIYLEMDDTLYWERIGESSYADGFREDDYSKKLQDYYIWSYVDIYIDTEGNIFAFHIDDVIDIGECVERKKVISVKEALEKVYDTFKDTVLKYELVVRDIQLEYRVCMDNTVDKNGYRNAHIEPVWTIKYTTGGMYENQEISCSTMIVSATTGEVLATGYWQ